MSGGIRGLAALLAGAALALTACSGGDSSAPEAGPTPVLSSPTTSPTIPPKPFSPPGPRTCYRLGYDDEIGRASCRERV